MANENPELLHQLRGPKDVIMDLDFHPKSKQVAAASADSTIVVWSLGLPDIRAYKFCGHSEAVMGVAFSPSGHLLASCSRDRTVRVWINGTEGRSTDFKAHTGAVRHVTFSPDGQNLLTSSEDKSVKLWTINKHRFISSFTGHTSWVRCAKFSPDGDVIATCSDDRTVRLFDPSSGKEIHIFNEPKGIAHHVDFHPSGTCIGVATSDNSVKVYDIRMRKLQQLYKSHEGPVSQIVGKEGEHADHLLTKLALQHDIASSLVSFHPNGSYLMSGSQDKSLVIFDLLEARPILNVFGHKDSVNAVKFSPGGAQFASGGADNLVFLWKSNLPDVIEPVEADQDLPAETFNKPVDAEEPGKRRDVLEEKSVDKENLGSKFRSIPTANLTPKKRNNDQDVLEQMTKMNEKMEALMQTIILMEKRLTLVEDQLRITGNKEA